MRFPNGVYPQKVETEPISDTESVDMPESTQDFKTDLAYDGSVEETLQDSKYFRMEEEKGSEARYRSKDVVVKVDREKGAVEYSVAGRPENQRDVQEFVEGIVRSIDDVTDEFHEEIRVDTYPAGKAMTDGGYPESEAEKEDQHTIPSKYVAEGAEHPGSPL